MNSLRHLSTICILMLTLPACALSGRSQPKDVQAAEMQNHTPTAVETQVKEEKATATLPADFRQVCPVTTQPEILFIPPAPYPPVAPGNYFWYGSEALWTAVPTDGLWQSLPHNPGGYTNKVLWWRVGYSPSKEPQPALTLTAQRLDASAPEVKLSDATNASAKDIYSAMLIGVDFPTLGCWKVTGQYADVELSFVVWISP